jgi:hypothetical protein
MHIILVGASHGWRLFQALKRIPGYGVTFKVTCLCVRGARFADLFWPQTVQKDDFLVIIPFGNDVHIRRFVKYDRFRKVFHLERFVPYQKGYWDSLFSRLREKLSDKNCNKIVIDNFYRHLCCERHRHKGWLAYQSKVNKELRDQFKDTSIRVVDHRLLLPNTRNCKLNASEYRKLQGDSVHFRDYFPIAIRLLNLL